MKFLFKSKTGKQIMGMVYGLGAAVVIVGAWAKILHLPIANIMITVGLLTEAFIFAISAFEPPHEELDWTLVYPELAGEGGHGHGKDKDKGKKGAAKDSISQELDKLLEEAKIGPELIQSLGDGMRKLSESANSLSSITDAGAATNEYVSSVKSAATNVSKLSDSYVKAAESLTVISTADGQSYGEQLQRVSKNLAALNSVYELQIQGTKEYVESSAKAYSNITELLKYLDASVEDTKRYKEEIHALGKNLSALNTVYGNMLAAMNINR
ncbi:MAG: gliding motility protein GldL [Flavobacteriales bacterium]|nr:gliding motility protein GldL [Flavobacteriales bacterium]